MKQENSIILFNQKEVRRHWNDDKELWYFSIVDVIAILTNSANPQAYWRKFKQRLKKENNETVTNCHGLKMQAIDGKMRFTDVADTEQLLRLIQSIPSPKAEPFKLWLAKVGYERIEETEDPELAFERAMQTYLRKGCSKEWINQRLKSIDVRKDLTDEWQQRGVKIGREYAILTDEITKAWAGKSVKGYKKFKMLKKQNLRDNMTNLELVLNMLAEVSTTEISKKKKPDTFDKNRIVAREGGHVASTARKEIETQTGKSIVSQQNAVDLRLEGKTRALTVGLTGGIGSGKTLVAEFFSNLGITVIDADQIAREIVEPNNKLLHKIVQRFGKQLLNKDGALDRKQLRRIILYNSKEKKWLEELLHPVIYQRMEQLINQSSSPYCILVIPLLFETNHEYFVDRILVVDTPEETQIDRIVDRDRTTKESVQKIIAMQINREQRLAEADDLILNTGSKKELNDQVKKLHKKYLDNTS